MSEFLNLLASRWVALGTLVLALIVWAVVHELADPGDKVKVGPIEYTKQRPEKTEQLINKPAMDLDQPERNNARGRHANGDVQEISESSSVRSGTAPSRLYVSMTPNEIIEMVADMTSLQAEQYLEQTLKGKWMRFQGAVSNVGHHDYAASIMVSSQEGSALVRIPATPASAVSHLRIGEIVTVEGQIDGMDMAFRGGINLENGRLLSGK